MLKNKINIECTDGCNNQLEIEHIFKDKFCIQIFSQYKPNLIDRVRDCFDYLLGKCCLPFSDNIIVNKKQLEKIIEFVNIKRTDAK
jgi:hypothetical protein